MKVRADRLLRHLRRDWLKGDFWRNKFIFWIASLLVGVVAVMFARLCEKANGVFEGIYHQFNCAPFLITPFGLGLCIWISNLYFPEAKGSGIPQVIAARKMNVPVHKVKLLSIKIALAKIALTSTAILCGASVGREGPTVQVGGSIMMAIGRFFRVGSRNALVMAGSAAGMAAAFNTPIAGIVFAIEELSHSYGHVTSGIVMSVIIFAGAASCFLEGNYTYFGKIPAEITSSHELPAIILCVAICGILGGLFSRIIIHAERNNISKIRKIRKKYPIMFAVFCGFVVALCGYLSHGESFGTGYHMAKNILEGDKESTVLLSICKYFSMVFSYISGVPGGVFAPSLATGASIGGVIAKLTPTHNYEVVAILGMVSFLTGVVQAPITSFVIVMEMTDNHDMILPLMLSSIFATAFSKLVCRHSLYQFLAKGISTSQRADIATESTKSRTKLHIADIKNFFNIKEEDKTETKDN